MKPEDRLWLKIAETVGMSPSEVKEAHSATDFLHWKFYFEEEWTDRDKWEHYAAEIRFQLHLIWLCILSFGGKPDRELMGKTVKDFYVPFSFGPVKPESKPAEVTERRRRPPANDANLQVMKMGVLFAVGLNPDGSVPEGRKLASKKKPSGEK